MPSRNIIKTYVEEGVYHVYNRGVERRQIFMDQRDYSMFLHCFKRYLSPEPVLDSQGMPYPKLIGRVSLLSYCLMPNHFHLQLRQTDRSGMEQLMRRAMTSYTLYFNRRHKRVGSLFQSTYKARLALDDSDLLESSRYIHNNPLELGIIPDKYAYSSLACYVDRSAPGWLDTDYILKIVGGAPEYFAFVRKATHPFTSLSISTKI